VAKRRRLSVLAAAIAAALTALPQAFACARGYSYAGVYDPAPASGIAATITMLTPPAVRSGHVAAWVGVSGEGRHGEHDWLQVGLATPAGGAGSLYYELAQPGRPPQFEELVTGIEPGRRLRVALLELPFAPGRWIVISPAGIAGPFYLPRSHRAWEPIATAESYAENTRCNRYAFRFDGLQLAGPNGSWRAMRRPSAFQDPGWRLRRDGPSAFSATAA
jgi:hypothetical protein